MCADQTAGDATPDPMVGRTLGGEFRLVRLLGAGGMGSVYLAEQVSLRRAVAVKLLPLAATSSETSVARFQREAVAAARLQHPNIVQVHFFGQQDGQHFIAMEYVEGTSLSNRLQRLGKLPVAEAIRVTREVARALAAAHKQGVVHRDVKPENVFLGRDGGVKLGDFGLARDASAEGSISQAGQVFGTPLYMAPEQCRGAKVDERADIYSLGATIHHVVLGRPPYQAESLMGLLEAHVRAPLPTAESFGAGVPAALVVLVRRMLAKDPSQRPPTADEVVRALDAVMSSRAKAPSAVERSHPPTSPPARPVTPSAPGRSRLPLVVVGLLCVAVATAALMYRPPPAPSPAVASVEDSARLLREAEGLEKAGRMEEALAILARAEPSDVAAAAARARIALAIREGDAAHRRIEDFKGFLSAASIARVKADAEDSPELWGKVIDAVALAEPLAESEGEKAEIASIAAEARQRRDWSLAKAQAKRGNEEDAIRLGEQALTSLHSKELEEWVEGLKAARAATQRFEDALRAADQALASGDAATGRKRVLEALAIRSSDERALRIQARIDALDRAAGAADAIALGKRLIDEAKWEEAKAAIGRALTADPGNEEAKALLATADRRLRLAAAISRAHEAVEGQKWDLAAKAIEEVLVLDPANAEARAMEGRARDGLYANWMERGKALVAEGMWDEAKAAYGKAASLKEGDAAAKKGIAEAEELREADPRRFELANRLEGHEKWVGGVAFDREGALLASAAGDKTVRLWDPTTGKPLAVLTGHEDWVNSVAFSPVEGLLVSASRDRTVRVWNPARRVEERKYTKHAHPVYIAEFMPNGRFVASVDESGELRMWNVKNGDDAWTVRASRDRTQSLTISPDGKTIAVGSDDTTISLWNAANGKPLGTLRGHTRSVIDLDFSPDGKVLASAGYDDLTVRLWDWAAEQPIDVLKGHTAEVCSVAFPPETRVLVSGDRAGVLIVWDTTSRKAVHTLRQARGKVPDLAFTPDGKRLASASDDFSVELWSTPK